MSAQDNLDLYGRIYRSLFVGDAIAGERERHTLETLLASRISDPAILLGKIIMMVGTAWGMALASLLLGLLSANLGSGQGRWAFYGSFGLLGEALALSLLTSLLATSVGVVISLRSATVRQAQQLVMVAALVVLVGVTPVLPKQAVSALSTEEIRKRSGSLPSPCLRSWIRSFWVSCGCVFDTHTCFFSNERGNRCPQPFLFLRPGPS